MLCKHFEHKQEQYVRCLSIDVIDYRNLGFYLFREYSKSIDRQETLR